MKFYKRLFALSIFIVIGSVVMHAQTSVITYQGKLTEVGAPSNGLFDLTFKLFTTPSEGTPNVTVIAEDVPVTAGIFTVNLNFGTLAFSGNPPPDYFIEIAVRPGTSTGTFTTLSPRQPLTSSPYSIRTLSATSADSLSPICVLCVTDAQIIAIDGTKVVGPVANATTAGNVSGIVGVENGGTGSATKSFVDLTNDQRIRGNKEFAGTVATIDGGRFIGDGSGLTGVPTVIGDGSVITPKLADGSVTRAKLATNFRNGFDPQMVAQMRWDQIPLVPHFAEVGRTPSALAFDGTFMYVANKLDNNVMRIRTSTGMIEGIPIPVGNGPAALVFDGFRSIWVANSGAGTLSRISIQNAVVDMTITVGSQPCALASDGTLIYVADCNSSFVARVNRNSGAILDQITVGQKSVSLAFDGTYVYVSEGPSVFNGRIRRILVSTGAVELIVSSSLTAGSLAFDGTFIYVTSANIIRIRKSTGVFENRVVRVVNPLISTGEALAFDGTFLYSSGRDNGSPGNPDVVIKLNINGLSSERSPIPTDGAVKALAFDGTYVYAASDRLFTDPATGMTTVINGAVTRF